jgi:hypothetical protein
LQSWRTLRVKTLGVIDAIFGVQRSKETMAWTLGICLTSELTSGGAAVRLATARGKVRRRTGPGAGRSAQTFLLTVRTCQDCQVALTGGRAMSSLLGLPRELRDQIIEDVLNSAIDLPFHDTFFPSPEGFARGDIWPVKPIPPHRLFTSCGLLLTNRQLNAEVTDALGRLPPRADFYMTIAWNDCKSHI